MRRSLILAGSAVAALAAFVAGAAAAFEDTDLDARHRLLRSGAGNERGQRGDG